MAVLSYPGLSGREILSGAPHVYGPTGKLAASQHGTVYEHASTSGQYKFDNAFVKARMKDRVSAFTVMVIARVTNDGTWRTLLNAHYNTASWGTTFGIWFGNNGNRWGQLHYTTTAGGDVEMTTGAIAAPLITEAPALSVPPYLRANEWKVYTAVHLPDGTTDFWWDKIFVRNSVTGSTATVGFGTSTWVSVGGAVGEPGNDPTGRFLFAGIWPRELSRAEINLMVDDYYGLVRPVPIAPRFFSFGDGSPAGSGAALATLAPYALSSAQHAGAAATQDLTVATALLTAQKAVSHGTSVIDAILATSQAGKNMVHSSLALQEAAAFINGQKGGLGQVLASEVAAATSAYEKGGTTDALLTLAAQALSEATHAGTGTALVVSEPVAMALASKAAVAATLLSSVVVALSTGIKDAQGATAATAAYGAVIALSEASKGAGGDTALLGLATALTESLKEGQAGTSIQDALNVVSSYLPGHTGVTSLSEAARALSQATHQGQGGAWDAQAAYAVSLAGLLVQILGPLVSTLQDPERKTLLADPERKTTLE